MSAIEV
jgi:hypothetical protein